MADCGPDCEETLREIEAYLDGEVEAPQATAIEIHLADCNPCMDRAEFRQHLKDLVHDRCREAEPEGLRDKVLEVDPLARDGSPTAVRHRAAREGRSDRWTWERRSASGRTPTTTSTCHRA